MKRYINIKLFLTCICTFHLLAGHGQSFFEEMEDVAAHYTRTNSFVLEWKNYLMNSPSNSEIYVLKKCDDYYYLKGNGQIHCINGSTQIGISEDEKSIAYLEDVDQTQKVDPIILIASLLENASEPKVIDQKDGVKHYSFYQGNQVENKVEVWIDVKNHRILKAIQYADEELGGGFVFEFIRFSSACEMGPEMRIQYYVTFGEHDKPQLTSRYKEYELFTIDSFMESHGQQN